MKSQMWVVRVVPVASALVLAAAPVAFAQYGVYGQNGSGSGSELFEWNGRVDREVQVVMRGNQVWTNQIGQTEGRGRSRVMDNLPRRDGQVVVQVLNGRGNVQVVQQPNAQNNYTTIVDIQDPRGGSDNYRLAAYWQGYSNGDVYGRNNGRARGRDRDRDDIYRGRDNGNYPNGNDRNGGYYPGGINGNNSMMHWSGNVDDDMEIRIQNGRITYRTLSGKDPTGIRADQGNLNMPNGARGVSVVQNQGRGTVVVTQQPSSWNGYTTVLRVRDPQGGYGYYDFSLMWQ